MRYAESRQKSCQPCSKAKTRCDRRVSSCSRCVQRKLHCSYPEGKHLSKPLIDGSELEETSIVGTRLTSHAEISSMNWPSDQEQSSTFVSTPHDFSVDHLADTPNSAFSNSERTLTGKNTATPRSMPHSHSRPSTAWETHNLNTAELVCPINANEISNRWLNQFIPLTGQKTKNYPANVGSFIYKILKSYATAAIHGRGAPPFIHYSQLTADTIRSPLSTCLSLVRVCQQSLTGATPSIADVLEREMNRLCEQYHAFNELDILATFQAYLIYAMVLFFQLGQGRDSFLRQAVMNLQQLACVTSQHGLVCIAEQEGTRPRWEAWIIVEAKRRTLYTMYLFDSVLSTYEGLPTFLGTELEGLPAPSNKLLWNSIDRGEWHKAYSKHLSEWVDQPLCIDELWPVATDFTDSQRTERDFRIAQWLENLDEYGVMLYTVTSCTHGV